MSKLNKVLVIVGCGVVGALNGCSIVFPSQVLMYSGISIGVAGIIGAITGISLRKES
jgi:hypothetical protein